MLYEEVDCIRSAFLTAAELAELSCLVTILGLCRDLTDGVCKLFDVEFRCSAHAATFTDAEVLNAPGIIVKVEPLRENYLWDSTAAEEEVRLVKEGALEGI